MQPPYLLLLLLLLPLSSGQITETLRHGSIFGWLRAAGMWAADRRGLLGVLTYPLQVFTCAFCLSHWGAAVAVALAVSTVWVPELLWVLVWLAVIRVSNFISDAWHPIRRTNQKEARERLLGVTDEELEQEYLRRTGDTFPMGPAPAPPEHSGSPAGVPGSEDLPKENHAAQNMLGSGGLAGSHDEGSSPFHR